VLGIPTSPVTWPIGSGMDFQGIYDRETKRLLRYERGEKGHRTEFETVDLDDPAFIESLGETAHAQLRDELELQDAAGNRFTRASFLAGEVTPVFFGSAINDFGVEPFLDAFLKLAPAPAVRATPQGPVPPDSPFFSGFVFKIQANMDPA